MSENILKEKKEFLSRTLIAAQLRQPEDDDSLFPLYDLHLGSAMSAIQTITGRKILEATEERRLSRYLNRYRTQTAAKFEPYYSGLSLGSYYNAQVVLQGPDIVSVEVKTWSGGLTPEETGAWEEPDEDIVPSRVKIGDTGARLWPPQAGWPGKEIFIALKVGQTEKSPHLGTMRKAALTFIQTAFDGNTRPEENEAFLRLLSPVEWRGDSADEREGV